MLLYVGLLGYKFIVNLILKIQKIKTIKCETRNNVEIYVKHLNATWTLGSGGGLSEVSRLKRNLYAEVIIKLLY